VNPLVALTCRAGQQQPRQLSGGESGHNADTTPYMLVTQSQHVLGHADEVIE
jgi:hypothetical protein